MSPQAKGGRENYGTKEAKVIQVIETLTLKGLGTPEDPAYLCKEYWSLDGRLLAVNCSLSG